VVNGHLAESNPRLAGDRQFTERTPEELQTSGFRAVDRLLGIYLLITTTARPGVDDAVGQPSPTAWRHRVVSRGGIDCMQRYSSRAWLLALSVAADTGENSSVSPRCV
jgi:hypothetical protein